MPRGAGSPAAQSPACGAVGNSSFEKNCLLKILHSKLIYIYKYIIYIPVYMLYQLFFLFLFLLLFLFHQNCNQSGTVSFVMFSPFRGPLEAYPLYQVSSCASSVVIAVFGRPLSFYGSDIVLELRPHSQLVVLASWSFGTSFALYL